MRNPVTERKTIVRDRRYTSGDVIFGFFVSLVILLFMAVVGYTLILIVIASHGLALLAAIPIAAIWFSAPWVLRKLGV